MNTLRFAFHWYALPLGIGAALLALGIGVLQTLPGTAFYPWLYMMAAVIGGLSVAGVLACSILGHEPPRCWALAHRAHSLAA